MTTPHRTLQMALDALDAITDDVDGTGLNTMPSFDKAIDAIAALREALAQPEPEPVAHLYDDGTWIATQTATGRSLNDRMLFAGSPKIGVYTVATPPAAPADPWKSAVLDRLAAACMDAPQDEPPASILRRIIDWEVAVAMDPAVSSVAPAGMVMVPREPTHEMLYAMAELDGWRKGDRDHPMFTRWRDYWNAALTAAPAPAVPDDSVRDKLIEALTRELGDTYDCTRVWEAWHFGNMSQDDFEPVLQRVDDIAQSLLDALSAAPAVREPQDERAAFEAWHSEYRGLVPLRRDDSYFDTHARLRWEGWQARAHGIGGGGNG